MLGSCTPNSTAKTMTPLQGKAEHSRAPKGALGVLDVLEGVCISIKHRCKIFRHTTEMPDFRRGSSGRILHEAAAEKFRIASAWLRDYVTAIKNGHIHPFTSMERKAREATRNEAWYVLRSSCVYAVEL